MIDQTQLAEDLSSKIKYEFRQMFLVKPLEPVKVKKKISEPVAKDTKPKKDKDGIEAVDYDEVKTEIKESSDDINTFAHESFHAAVDMLEACHIKLSDDTNEVFAYLIGYFTECVNKTANKR